MFFHKKLQVTPLRRSLELARVEIEGIFSNKSSNLRWQHDIKALREIENLLGNLSSSSNSSTSEAVGEGEGYQEAWLNSNSRASLSTGETNNESESNRAAWPYSSNMARPPVNERNSESGNA
ncbi:hypothetical protein R1flu_009227 [Riccia fluitans]|uniref:Uncharacterized protein n=1 Tax=Riccia fluitans TaxID=41844 RepID=A0ABD1Z1G8_9MARC